MTLPNLPPMPQTVRADTAPGLRALRSQIARARRLIERLQADAARAEGADALRLAGEVLKTQLHAVPKGATVLELPVPWAPGEVVAVRLRPELSALDNLRQIFDRAKALARSRPLIAARQAASEARLTALQDHVSAHAALLARADAWQAARNRGEPTTERPRDILRAAQAWIAALGPLGVVVQAPPTVRERATVRPSKRDLPAGVEAFTAPAGAQVFAGRSAAANDALVTRVLRGRDLWFHLRDSPGAHVVLRAGVAAPPELEVQACAQLCAHLSGVAKADRAEVTVCLGKGVRKVKGAPAGSVYTTGGRSVLVVVRAEVVDGFYARRHGARVERQLGGDT